MDIHNFPEIFLPKKEPLPDLFVYDYKMTDSIVKHKSSLSLNMFSFLQIGQKKVHFADTTVSVNNSQSVLIKNGNCLLTDLLSNDQIYFCKLFFFSTNMLDNFITKHEDLFTKHSKKNDTEISFFIIENDSYIHAFIDTISHLQKLDSPASSFILATKLEEILLYLIVKYGTNFIHFLHSLNASSPINNFKKIIETNIYSTLKMEEIAFLCNMSVSTFKRHFQKEYQENPGKWLQAKRLLRAKKILEKEKQTASEIFADFGYNNLSSFSAAFKKEFGHNPSFYNKQHELIS